MIRILHVIGAMGCGGAEAMIMNFYRHLDRQQIQFDFVVHTSQESFYDKEIQQLGGRIYRTKKYNVKNFFSYKKWWHRFFEEHSEYTIIHGHIGSSAPVYLSEAKKYSLVTIAHSHSTGSTERTIKRYLWEICSYPTRKIADCFFACSIEAAIARFGEKIALSKRCQILKNAIDCDRFTFSEGKRMNMREKLNLENNLVVGHVGRFTAAKNHVFLVEVFENVYKKNRSARLLLLGEGELENDIRILCKNKGIEQAVIFAGVHENTEDYYAAMDVFCFPSKWEGFAISLVEAQTSGLHCVISKNIPKGTDIGAGLINCLNLEEPVDNWVDELLSIHDGNRIIAKEFAINAGFSIRKNALELQSFYYVLKENSDAKIYH